MPRLENWTLHDIYGEIIEPIDFDVEKAGIIFGFVYDDEKNRFLNGTYIHTSQVQEIDLHNRFGITRNTRYELGERLVKDDRG